MQTIQAELPVTLINKLKALAQIEGHPPGKIVQVLEMLINQRLAIVLGITAGPTVTPVATADSLPQEHDAASGLGEMVSEDEEKAAIAASLSHMDQQGPKISDQDLANDLKVDDSTKEAKADATTIRLAPDEPSEHAFDFSGEQRPAVTRKRQGAKVSAMTEFPGDTA